MPGATGQPSPSPETGVDLMLAREETLARIARYNQSDNKGKRYGSIINELGRVGGRDLEFALELAQGLEFEIQPNAYAAIGGASGDIGALAVGRDIALSSDLKPAKLSDKLAKVATASAKVDPAFALETAKDIPRPSNRTDALIEIAEIAKWKYMKPNGLGYPPRMELRNPDEENNFSLSLFRQIVREADRTINANTALWGMGRNKKLAKVSAELDLPVTYRSLLREGIPEKQALHEIYGHIKGYIDEDRLDDLSDAVAPHDELIVGAFRENIVNVEPIAEDLIGGVFVDRGNESLRREIHHLARELGIDEHALIGNAMRLINYFGEEHPVIYSGLLAVISEAASAEKKRFGQDQERLKESGQAGSAEETW